MAYGHGESPYCCFHPSPREVVVGVCAHCLKDRLLCLKQQQQQQGLRRRRTTTSSSSSIISLPKVFALGSSFLQRLDSRHHHDGAGAGAAPSDDGTTSAASLDDSFISIKFEDNGKATWDTHTKAEEAAPPVLQVVEHAAAAAKRGRWRKQVVGRLLQLARWKRSAADGNKAAKARAARPGWIRSLTRRRAATAHPWS